MSWYEALMGLIMCFALDTDFSCYQLYCFLCLSSLRIYLFITEDGLAPRQLKALICLILVHLNG